MIKRSTCCYPGLGVALTALLAACASQDGDPTLAACPPAQIAVPSDRIGHSDDDGELRFVAIMEQLASSCRLDEDDIEVDIAFTMSAERGPAFEGQPVRLAYFLATVDPKREIVDKQILGVELAFGPDQQVSALRESVTLRLPASTEASGANYRVPASTPDVSIRCPRSLSPLSWPRQRRQLSEFFYFISRIIKEEHGRFKLRLAATAAANFSLHTAPLSGNAAGSVHSLPTTAQLSSLAAHGPFYQPAALRPESVKLLPNIIKSF